MLNPGIIDFEKLVNPNGVIPAFHLLVCVLAAAIVRAIPVLRKPSSLLLICALATVSIYRFALFGFLLTNIAVFLFVIGLDRITSNRPAKARLRWRFSCVAILILVIGFLVGRSWRFEQYGLSFAGIRWILFSLDMWLVLRLVTVLWEFGSGRIVRPTLFSYSLWAAFPFVGFGPIIRYSQFDPQVHNDVRTEVIKNTFSVAWFTRILIAALQVIAGVVLTNLHNVMYAAGGTGLPLWAKLLDGFGISPWGFLFVWSGYYKLMECLALSWGVVLPPSFNRPFSRSNISEFWANWNMTATAVFRDYLFYNRWGARNINVYLNTLIIFTLVGMWHSFNAYWIMWGLLHGIGFCIFIWYSQSKNRRQLSGERSPPLRSRLLGTVVTYVFVCSCWLIPSQLLKIVGRI